MNYDNEYWGKVEREHWPGYDGVHGWEIRGLRSGVFKAFCTSEDVANQMTEEHHAALLVRVGQPSERVSTHG